MALAIYTVSQVAAYLRGLLEADEALAGLWVEGEISNLARPASGHSYFTLKDQGAQLRCVLFRGQNQGFPLEDGAQVVAHGRVSLYEARGQLQLYVDFLQPQGLGPLHLQLEYRKRKLGEEGLFEPSRKRPLPPFPRRIGLVTSPTGAVLQDICTILGRRWPLAELVLSPTAVQGEEAAPQIVAALHRLYALAELDLVIVARGGGSLEELWPFNEEAVARAIFKSPFPIISAVGHETDVTIADLVADLRAPTPSAAAEIAVPDRAEVARRLGVYQGALAAAARALVIERRQALQRLQEALRQGALAALATRQGGLERLTAQMAALNPRATLSRGYAVVEKGRELVQSVAQVRPGDGLTVHVADGPFAAQVGPPRNLRFRGEPRVDGGFHG